MGYLMRIQRRPDHLAGGVYILGQAVLATERTQVSHLAGGAVGRIWVPEEGVLLSACQGGNPDHLAACVEALGRALRATECTEISHLAGGTVAWVGWRPEEGMVGSTGSVRLANYLTRDVDGVADASGAAERADIDYVTQRPPEGVEVPTMLGVEIRLSNCMTIIVYAIPIAVCAVERREIVHYLVHVTPCEGMGGPARNFRLPGYITVDVDGVAVTGRAPRGACRGRSSRRSRRWVYSGSR